MAISRITISLLFDFVRLKICDLVVAYSLLFYPGFVILSLDILETIYSPILVSLFYLDI